MGGDALSQYANGASVDGLEGFRTHGHWTLSELLPLRAGWAELPRGWA